MILGFRQDSLHFEVDVWETFTSPGPPEERKTPPGVIA